MVTDINNSGDMLGKATKNGVLTPAIWLDGVPYDLTDPANVGMVFDFDPGPKYLTDFDNHDLLALDVAGLPSYFLPTFCTGCAPFPPFDYGYGTNFIAPSAAVQRYALTNARGDIIFEYRLFSDRSHFGILRAIPEPSSVALVLLALVAIQVAPLSSGIFVRSRSS